MNINIKEVLRYLGYKNQILNETTKQVIEDCIEETKGLIREYYVYNCFNIHRENNTIRLENTNLQLPGSDIYNHLKNSSKCFLMAVTGGSEVDFKIRYYERVDLTRAIIMDACATAAVEDICDKVEEKIKAETLSEGFGVTYRYSPGYGDLPIELQTGILNLLEAQKRIGLTVSENFILFPRKSVSAIVGVQGLEFVREHPGCKSCSGFKYCKFRKEGNYCGA